MGNMLSYDGEAGAVQAYLARPAGDTPRPAVIVIHEIFGLTDHIKHVADRFMEQGYVAFAPDLFSRPGLEALTPTVIEEAMPFMRSVPREKLSDAAYMQQTLPAGRWKALQPVLHLLIGGIPKAQLTQDLVKAHHYLQNQPFVQAEKMGSVGFCFGGGMSINFACHAPLAASIIFYGENPSPIELIENVKGPVMGLYGVEDARINGGLDALVKAMATYKKDFEMRIYPGAGHAFFNDTRATVYRADAAADAWQRVLRFYQRTLLA